jgi:hypothetical protein
MAFSGKKRRNWSDEAVRFQPFNLSGFYLVWICFAPQTEGNCRTRDPIQTTFELYFSPFGGWSTRDVFKLVVNSRG